LADSWKEVEKIRRSEGERGFRPLEVRGLRFQAKEKKVRRLKERR